MQLSNPTRWFFGVLSITPLLSLFWGLWATFPLAQVNHELALRLDAVVSYLGWIALGISFVALVAHLLRSKSFTQGEKIVWAVALFLANMMTLPLYWFLYVRPRSAQAPP